MNSLLICPNIKEFNRGLAADFESRAAEFSSLCAALSKLVIKQKIALNVSQIKVGTFFGSGKINEFRKIIVDNDIELVIVDSQLSPIQQRNLERDLKVKVLDRTGLILEIFGERAQSREGVLQVDLAHLEYQKTRLIRSWTHLERQRGGIGFMGGPGETQIESDRRAIAEKISRIKNSLQKIIKTRRLHRINRKKNKIPIIALVGYTNAGKSSLFNSLTNSFVLEKNMLFSTLDPTMRTLSISKTDDVLLVDTVGFISDLPTNLISAFTATLEEVIYADLLLHVRDISDHNTEVHAAEVEKIITQLPWGKNKIPPLIQVLNKIDLLDFSQLKALTTQLANSEEKILVSARKKIGLEYLTSMIKKHTHTSVFDEKIVLKFSQTKIRAWLFENSLVTKESILEDGYSIKVRWNSEQKGRFLKDKLENNFT